MFKTIVFCLIGGLLLGGLPTYLCLRLACKMYCKRYGFDFKTYWKETRNGVK